MDGRRVGPPRVRLQHMHDAADDATVIDPRLAARVARKKWRKLCKLRLRWPGLNRSCGAFGLRQMRLAQRELKKRKFLNSKGGYWIGVRIGLPRRKDMRFI